EGDRVRPPRGPGDPARPGAPGRRRARLAARYGLGGRRAPRADPARRRNAERRRTRRRAGGRALSAAAEPMIRVRGLEKEYEGATVEEYLDFFAASYHIPRRERRVVVRDVMELTDLGKLSRKLVEGLSKGMKQRLCLAKTLVHDPRVLILDAPAAGLDPRA